MKLTFLVIMFCVAFGLSAFSQTMSISNLQDLSDQFMFEKSKTNAINGNYYGNIEGTPFLNNDFIEGEIIISDNVKIEKIPLRYNVYADKMEFRNEQQEVLQMNMSNQFFKLSFGSLNFVNLNYISYGKKQQGILEQLIKGQISCYKKYGVEFKEATKAMGYQDAEPNRFIRLEDEYLIAINDNEPETFRKKQLFEKLEKLIPGIEKTAKKKKFKIKTESGLMQLIKYCNSTLDK